MKKYKITYIVLILLSTIMVQNALRSEMRKLSCFTIEDGNITMYAGDIVKTIPIDGSVCCAWEDGGGLWYLASKQEKNALICSIGFIDVSTMEPRFHKKVPVEFIDEVIRKCMAGEGIIYIQTNAQTNTGNGGTLYRISINTMEISRLPGVLDFDISGGHCVLVQKQEGRLYLNMNEHIMPLIITGEPRITCFIDGRIVMVSSGGETEVVDILANKSLYQYSSLKEYLVPDAYNLTIEVMDDKGKDDDHPDMIFYKVFIDSIEIGRTDVGPAALPREFTVKLEPNKYHLVKLERWILNSSKGRYDRANNVYQPNSQKLFIPGDRIVKINVRFNGKEYRFNMFPAYR